MEKISLDLIAESLDKESIDYTDAKNKGLILMVDDTEDTAHLRSFIYGKEVTLCTLIAELMADDKRIARMIKNAVRCYELKNDPEGCFENMEKRLDTLIEMCELLQKVSADTKKKESKHRKKKNSSK